MAEIVVNDEPREIPDATTITALLTLLNLPASRVAVEVNQRLVRRLDHPTCVLLDGDRVEIVTMVGGG